MNLHQSGIFIVMKYPEIGNVKSRLGKSIGAEAATNLYHAFIQDTIKAVESIECSFYIAVHPPSSLEQFTQLVGSSYNLFPQKGMNLGERLQNGFLTMFDAGYKQAIALASDSPDLPSHILEEALSSLQTHDAVLGPTPDGGYYLIGFSYERFVPEVFIDVPWGSESVFEETIARIRPSIEQLYLLPEWDDIDTKDDLRKFYERYKSESVNSLDSMKFLRSHPELIEILYS
ncbi:MAG: TIGR04282 family arsenosugar biosynthesis glycosyltransferase [Candidatus Thorarchaeota archaeon]